MQRNPGSMQRVALDIKVINALGTDHFDLTLQSSQAALSSYRDQQMEHLNTFAQCAARGIHYEPMVFSAQGGCETHAEGIPKARAKAEIMQ